MAVHLFLLVTGQSDMPRHDTGDTAIYQSFKNLSMILVPLLAG